MSDLSSLLPEQIAALETRLEMRRQVVAAAATELALRRDQLVEKLHTLCVAYLARNPEERVEGWNESHPTLYVSLPGVLKQLEVVEQDYIQVCRQADDVFHQQEITDGVITPEELAYQKQESK